MNKGRFREKQIIRIPKEVEPGAKVTEVVQERGICAGTFNRLRVKYDGLEG